MKKGFRFFIALFAIIMLFGCKNNTGDKTCPPVCSIISPEDGTLFKWGDEIIICGTGSDEDGIISDILLEINGEKVENLKMIPFEYTVGEKYIKPGKMEIKLTVADNTALSATDEITITIGEVPVPPVCSIDSPEDNAELELEDNIIIKGSGSDSDGEITDVVLKINGAKVAEVTKIPFEWTLGEDYKKAGMMEIVLEVKDNDGLTDSDTVKVNLLGQFRTCTDSRDGKTYKTVKIGTQEWFAENLAWLPVVNKPSDFTKEAPRYYVYGYDGEDINAAKASEYYATLGVLYNWCAAGGDKEADPEAVPSGIQGPCPDGWHIPSKAEWEILYSYVRERIPEEEAATYWDGSSVYNVNGHLRTKEGWPTSSDSDFPQLAEGGFDTYGFSAFVSGALLESSPYFFYGPDKRGNYVTFWLPYYDAITYPSNPGGYSTSISSYKYEPSFGQGTSISRGHAVRCLKN